ncbi:PDZ domain-containing protein [Puniceicoccaceae bacterium K14]|nr:PDZ domain-containing protein [Puniceicoccaceae bacterium K14]
MKNLLPCFRFLILFSAVNSLSTGLLCFGTDIYVSPVGENDNPGTSEEPISSLAKAKELARSAAGKEPVTIHVADGTYYLPETLVFTPEDSGTESAPVFFKAENEGKAIISGGSLLNLKWKKYRDGIFKAKTAADLKIDQLFIDGERQRMARYPNYDASKKAEAYQGFAADAFSKERTANWADPEGGYIHAMHRLRWGGYHFLITGKNEEGEIAFEGGWQNNRPGRMHDTFRMVENIFEELDAEGEWYHDSENAVLYFKPTSDMNLKSAKVEVVRLRRLVEFQGSEENPVTDITLQGFIVRHAARTFMDTKEELLRSDWTIYRGGAYLLAGTENIRILDTHFDQVGGNAIFVSNYNRGTLVKGCHIENAGASGVCFVGDPDAVRNPLFDKGARQDLTKIDRTPGPKTNNYPQNGTVADCLIHGIGIVERQPAGVQISMAMDITVRDTSIYDCARAGINVSEGTWGGHLIERCDVFDTVLETHDHGSFNSWGRDRFWGGGDSLGTQQAVDEDPSLPFLDAWKTTVIRDSRWRCDHGWDVDLDDGSSNYDIYNNVMLAGGLKLREGFRRRAWNNIMVNSGLHPHVWYNNSNDEVYSNILMDFHRDIRVNFPGKRIDENLFFSKDPAAMETEGDLDWDENSILGNPMFEDPANGNFRVKAGSDAFKIGFANFPMDQFGVKKPSLKALARTPVIPELVEAVGRTAKEAPIVEKWMGATLHAISGEEYSAYGVRKDQGGVALVNVPKGSDAEKAGFEANDLIQGVNDSRVSKVLDLYESFEQAKKGDVEVNIVRDQKNQVIKVRKE